MVAVVEDDVVEFGDGEDALKLHSQALGLQITAQRTTRTEAFAVWLERLVEAIARPGAANDILFINDGCISATESTGQFPTG